MELSDNLWFPVLLFTVLKNKNITTHSRKIQKEHIIVNIIGKYKASVDGSNLLSPRLKVSKKHIGLKGKCKHFEHCKYKEDCGECFLSRKWVWLDPN